VRLTPNPLTHRHHHPHHHYRRIQTLRGVVAARVVESPWGYLAYCVALGLAQWGTLGRHA